MKKVKKFKSRDFGELEKENRSNKIQNKKKHKKLRPLPEQKWTKNDYYRIIDEEE